MCYNFSIALDSRFGRSPLWVKPKAKECGKGIRQKKGRVIFRKILYQRRGGGEKIFQVMPEEIQVRKYIVIIVPATLTCP